MHVVTKYGSVLALACALGAGACSSGPNPEKQLSEALKDAQLKDVKVDWDSDARIAHLKGTVDQTTDRQRAEDIATAAVGTSGRVLNEVTVKGVDDRTADAFDSDIARQLDQAIKSDQVLRDRDVNFDVNNGVVTVKGEVRTAEEKTKVGEIVRSAPGVKSMANALEIKPKK